MNQLSGLDAAFLYLETPEMPMHVGALHVFELPTGYKGRFVRDLRRHMAERLPLAPVLRRRLWWMPLNLANPAWVDAEVDLNAHIVEIKLPKSAKVGGGMIELEDQVSQLHSVLLDRKRPLWKMHVFEGLAPGPNGRKRVGLYTQLHHAAVDGQAAVALANAILDTSPTPRAVEARLGKREHTFEIGMTEMLRGVLGQQAQKVAQIIRELPGTVSTLGSAAGQALGSVGQSALPLIGRGRKRTALYTQLHHAAVDGQAAVALANVILDLSPHPPPIEMRASKRQKVFRLNMVQMLRGALASEAMQVAGIIKELPATVGTLAGAARQVIARSPLVGGKGGSVSNVTLAPRTPLNVSVGPGRAFATVTLSLTELKALGKAHEATINDMVLMVCSSALRRFYGKRHVLPRKSMIAAVPISLRERGDTSSDNQASMSLISLGTHIADPRQRLAHVKAATAAMKSTMGSVKSILPTDYPSIGVPWLIEAATALYGKAKVADRIPQVANVVISNVPGPPVPLYMAGAHMLTNYPTSIVTHGLALNITVQSYDRSLDFGLMADAKAMPDVRELADAIRIAFDDIKALPLPGEHGDEVDAAPRSVLQRSRRAISGAVSAAAGKAAQKVVGAAVNGVVAQVTRRTRAGAPTRKRSSR